VRFEEKTASGSSLSGLGAVGTYDKPIFRRSMQALSTVDSITSAIVGIPTDAVRYAEVALRRQQACTPLAFFPADRHGPTEASGERIVRWSRLRSMDEAMREAE